MGDPIIKILSFIKNLKFEKKAKPYTYKEETISNENDQDEVDVILDKISKTEPHFTSNSLYRFKEIPT